MRKQSSKGMIICIFVLAIVMAIPFQAHANESLNDISKKRHEINEKDSDIKAEIESLILEMESLHNEIVDLETIIENNEKVLADIDKEKQGIERDIEEVQKRIDFRLDILKERARSFQKQDNNLFLDIVFSIGETSFSELISKITLINRVAEADKELIREQEADKSLIVEKLTELEDIESELDDINKISAEEVQSLEAAKEALQENESLLQSKLNSLRAEDQALGEKEYELLMERAEEAAKISASSSKAKKIKADDFVADADFAWPTEGGYISSGMGLRWGTLHKGIDIARTNRAGTPPIYAVADGIVELAEYGGGYGNTIIIDHGNGLKTRYAHMSELTVAPGDEVEKGDKIGIMGATGDSRGIHLHFEVYHRDTLQNPLYYIKQ